MESLEGTKKDVILVKKVKCKACNGTRSHQARPPSKCWTCYGKGVNLLKNGPYLEEQTCFKCQGSGYTVKEKCKPCSGEGHQTETVVETIKIKPFNESEKTLTFEHKGHFSSFASTGNLLVKVKVNKHDTIYRQGDHDLQSDVTVPYYLGVLGGQIEVENVYGEKRIINIDPFMPHNKKTILKGEGGPKGNNKSGDHIINLNFTSPVELNDEEKSLYSKLTEIE